MNYNCEDETACVQIQAAICLHCHRRLCFTHLTEHNNLLADDINDLSNNIQSISQEIQTQSKKHREFFDQSTSILKQSYVRQQQKLKNLYENALKSVESDRKICDDLQSNLFQQFDEKVIQPSKQLLEQCAVNAEYFNQIKTVIDNIRKESSTAQERFFALTTSMNSTRNARTEPINKRSLKKMIHRFSQLVFVDRSKQLIRCHIAREGARLEISYLIYSYLAAWHRKSNKDEKFTLLNKYVSIFQELLASRNENLRVLFGIQTFFVHEIIHEDKSKDFISK